MRRDHVALTLIRRHFDVMCLLGIPDFGDQKQHYTSREVMVKGRRTIFMPPPVEEWWKGHIVLPLSIRPSVSVCFRGGVSNLRLSFLGVSNLPLSFVFCCFFMWGHPCPLNTFLVFILFLFRKKKSKPEVLKEVKHTSLLFSPSSFSQIAFPNARKEYSRTSLSRTRLFRITDYLEAKIWSLFYLKLWQQVIK